MGRPAHSARGAISQLRRHERLRRRVTQPVQVHPRLTAQLDHVREPIRADQRGARRTPLQQRVRRDRHAVREPRHVSLRGARPGEHLVHRLEHALRLVRRRRQNLGGVHRAVLRDEHGVGERPAYVYPEKHPRERTHVRAY